MSYLDPDDYEFEKAQDDNRKPWSYWQRQQRDNLKAAIPAIWEMLEKDCVKEEKE